MGENNNLNINNSEKLLVSVQFNTDLYGLGKKIADSFEEMDLSDFDNKITLTGNRSYELVGFIRSQSNINISYFPENLGLDCKFILGKEINLDNYLGFI
jgi:hypothetical protein